MEDREGSIAKLTLGFCITVVSYVHGELLMQQFAQLIDDRVTAMDFFLMFLGKWVEGARP